MNFDEFWSLAVPFLTEKIREAGGTLEMDNWTVDGRHRRDTIPITEARENGITCLTENGVDIRATRRDLLYTYGIWDDYENEVVRREDIRDNTYRSVFTICTIHYVKENHPLLLTDRE